MHFTDLKKSFDGVARKVFQLAMRGIGIPVALVISSISLHAETKRRVRVDSELSVDDEIKVGMHQGSV